LELARIPEALYTSPESDRRIFISSSAGPSGYGYKLPVLVADLNGQIRVVLKGKVDSGPNKGIRNTFEAVPTPRSAASSSK
jgi:hypothetical protein